MNALTKRLTRLPLAAYTCPELNLNTGLDKICRSPSRGNVSSLGYRVTAPYHYQDTCSVECGGEPAEFVCQAHGTWRMTSIGGLKCGSGPLLVKVPSSTTGPIHIYVTDGSQSLFTDETLEKEIGPLHAGDQFVTPLDKSFLSSSEGTLLGISDVKPSWEVVLPMLTHPCSDAPCDDTQPPCGMHGCCNDKGTCDCLSLNSTASKWHGTGCDRRDAFEWPGGWAVFAFHLAVVCAALVGTTAVASLRAANAQDWTEWQTQPHPDRGRDSSGVVAGSPEAAAAQPQNAALLEAKAVLEAAGQSGMGALRGLVGNWSALAEEGFDSLSSLRLAKADDLAEAGLAPAEAAALLGALQPRPASQPPDDQPNPEPDSPEPEPGPEPEPEPNAEQRVHPGVSRPVSPDRARPAPGASSKSRPASPERPAPTPQRNRRARWGWRRERRAARTEPGELDVMRRG